MSDPAPIGATPDGAGTDEDPLAFDLADRLHKALRLGKCKPGEMRRILGVSESTMTNYLSGQTSPKAGMLRQWALRCGPVVTFEWLATGIHPACPTGGPISAEPGSPCTRSPLVSELAPVVPIRKAAA